MRRWVLRGVLLLVGVGICFGFWARLLAGGPVSFIPGGWIRGEPVAEPVDDWSFAAGDHYLLVESRARFLPYSQRVWFMVLEGRLYLLLPSLFGDGLQQRLEEDPRLRVGIEGRVYTQRAVAVEGDAQAAQLLAPMLRRTMSVEIEGPLRRLPGASSLEGAGMAIYELRNP